jgi:hypothetical protein
MGVTGGRVGVDVRVALLVTVNVADAVCDGVLVAVEVDPPLRVGDGVGVRHSPATQMPVPGQSSSSRH